MALLAVVVTAVMVMGADPGVDIDTGGTPVRSAGGMPTPVLPPAVGDSEWSADFGRVARACFGGSMTACDDLYWESSVDDFYEFYGSTCGGRLTRESRGGCVATFGSTLN